jgi:hypothetical protein
MDLSLARPIDLSRIKKLIVPEGEVMKITYKGELLWETRAKCTLSYNILNASLSNTPTMIDSDTSYTTTITTTNGYQPVVSVIMDGVDVTNSVYDGNVTISIPAVTGNTSIKVFEKFINLLPFATDTDRTTIYNGIGYKSGVRISGSGGGAVAASGAHATGFIPVQPNDTLRILNIEHNPNMSSVLMSFDSSNTKTGSVGINSLGQSFMLNLDSATFGNSFDSIRFGAKTIDGNTIVLRNQEIVNSSMNILPFATEADRTTIYGGVGYKTNTRLSSSGGGAVSSTGMCTSGFIPAKPGDLLVIQNITHGSSYNSFIFTYDSTNTKKAEKVINTLGNSMIVKLDSATFGDSFDAIQFSAATIDENTIVAINPEISV